MPCRGDVKSRLLGLMPTKKAVLKTNLVLMYIVACVRRMRGRITLS